MTAIKHRLAMIFSVFLFAVPTIINAQEYLPGKIMIRLQDEIPSVALSTVSLNMSQIENIKDPIVDALRDLKVTTLERGLRSLSMYSSSRRVGPEKAIGLWILHFLKDISPSGLSHFFSPLTTSPSNSPS